MKQVRNSRTRRKMAKTSQQPQQKKNSKKQFKRLVLQGADLRLRLFIDPASISSGWALFEGKSLIDSGTIIVDKKLNVWKRLPYVVAEYTNLGTMFGWVDEVHIEKIIQTRRVQKAVHWSVGVIGTTLSRFASSVDDELPIASWQKFCDWRGKRKMLLSYKVENDDELAAIGMGLWYVSEKV